MEDVPPARQGPLEGFGGSVALKEEDSRYSRWEKYVMPNATASKIFRT